MGRLKYLFLTVMMCLFLFQCVTSDKNENNNNGNGNDNGGNSNPDTITSEYIINHDCTDLSSIPDQWIQSAKEQFRIHYAHTSHGEQIVVGLRRLSGGAAGISFSQSGNYRFYHEYCAVPSGGNGLPMMDGQQMDDYCETYITPDLYWEGDYGMNITRSVLQHFDVNVSLWAWCSQQDYYSEAETQNYLDRMAELEQEFPGVTFIYMTGNAQSEEQNRVDRNNQIREYCRDNHKFLLDFADIDCWYDGEHYVVNGIPMEHPHYNGDEAGHTTFESCENKGRAFWWLMARLAGWGGES